MLCKKPSGPKIGSPGQKSAKCVDTVPNWCRMLGCLAKRLGTVVCPQVCIDGILVTGFLHSTLHRRRLTTRESGARLQDPRSTEHLSPRPESPHLRPTGIPLCLPEQVQGRCQIEKPTTSTQLHTSIPYAKYVCDLVIVYRPHEQKYC